MAADNTALPGDRCTHFAGTVAWLAHDREVVGSEDGLYSAGTAYS